MAVLTDYQAQLPGVDEISKQQITQITRLICYNQTIYDDTRLEMSEFLGLTLEVIRAMSSVETIVEPGYADAAILIVDDDCKQMS